jgi:hypothetical protein
MKKSVKKLSLAKETVASMDSLHQAAGGWGTIETQCCNTLNQCTIKTIPSRQEA